VGAQTAASAVVGQKTERAPAPVRTPRFSRLRPPYSRSWPAASARRLQSLPRVSATDAAAAAVVAPQCVSAAAPPRVGGVGGGGGGGGGGHQNRHHHAPTSGRRFARWTFPPHHPSGGPTRPADSIRAVTGRPTPPARPRWPMTRRSRSRRCGSPFSPSGVSPPRVDRGATARPVSPHAQRTLTLLPPPVARASAVRRRCITPGGARRGARRGLPRWLNARAKKK